MDVAGKRITRTALHLDASPVDQTVGVDAKDDTLQFEGILQIRVMQLILQANALQFQHIVVHDVAAGGLAEIVVQFLEEHDITI